MNKIRTSDFWLADKNPDISDAFDFIKLQGAVANFVKIISGRDIPVEFQGNDNKSTKDVIVISADLTDIDATVGLAIHETMSFINSNSWTISKLVTLVNNDYLTARHPKYAEIPVSKRYKYKELVLSEMEGVYNMIEYWRIDALTIRTSPGYKGYVQATYNQLFNPNYLIKILIGGGVGRITGDKFFRFSYFFPFFALVTESYIYEEIIKTTPPDEVIVPGIFGKLKEIVNINNIHRLKSPEDSLQLAISVWELIDEYATNVLPQHLVSDSDSFENELDTDPDRFEESRLQSFAKEQFARAGLNIEKKKLSTDKKNDVEFMLSNASKYYTDYENRRVKVVVLNEITRDLIYSGRHSFLEIHPSFHTENAIKEGIELGKQLARKIAFRSDHKQTRFSRLKHGRIERRLLHTVACDNRDIFYKTREEPFPTVNFHISIDGSYSMSGACFLRSLKTAVAIAQAADIIKNITVTISVRYFTTVQNTTLPLVLIAYDSERDKLSKMKSMLRHLTAIGPTPEGLCYPVITDLMERKARSATITENYFINLYDGMPGFVIDDQCIYEGKPAIEHTRNEVLRMKRKGFKILSYFVIPATWKQREINTTFEHFKYMYGNDAKMININALNELARTLNRLLV